MAFKKSLCQVHQGFLSGIFLTLMLLTPSAKVLAEGGHGGSEFQGSGEASQMTKPSPINASIAEQMGIKVEPVTLQRLAIGIRATGQIETLPNRRVDVITPVGGTVIKLPLQYCNKLNKV